MVSCLTNSNYIINNAGIVLCHNRYLADITMVMHLCTYIYAMLAVVEEGESLKLITNCKHYSYEEFRRYAAQLLSSLAI